jgi:hypothetical protein
VASVIAGATSKLASISKRGLEPLPQQYEHSLYLSQKLPEAHSVSPLKRRVLIQGAEGARIGSSSVVGDDEAPLLRVISDRPESGRKVIKATITIPLPKADMGVIICKPRGKTRADDSEEQEHDDVDTDEDEEEFKFADQGDDEDDMISVPQQIAYSAPAKTETLGGM